MLLSGVFSRVNFWFNIMGTNFISFSNSFEPEIGFPIMGTLQFIKAEKYMYIDLHRLYKLRYL